MTEILFVCLGNIIRSPLAAKLFEREADLRGLQGKYAVDSAATSDYEIGQPPDERMLRTAARHGFYYFHRARQIERQDLEAFDLLIVMDLENKADIEALAQKPEQRAKIHLLREFDPIPQGNIAIPDPWYGGPSRFDEAYVVIERSVRGLLDALEAGKLT